MICAICRLPITPEQPMHDVRGVGPMHDTGGEFDCYVDWRDHVEQDAREDWEESNALGRNER